MLEAYSLNDKKNGRKGRGLDVKNVMSTAMQ
jgi:hypothetical protein